MQKQINEVAKAMVTKIYEEIANEDKAKSAEGAKPSSFTLQKFYEQNRDQADRITN